MIDGARDVRSALVIEQVEDAILAKLKENIGGAVKVEAFPDNPDRYDFANLPAALLIHSSGSQFSGREGPANKAQSRRMQFALFLLCRSLRGQGGAYNHLEDIRLALQGHAFAGAGPAEIVRDALDDQRDGIWRWQILIALNIPAVARHGQTPVPLMRPAITSP